jgi:hypothetical protein
MSKRKEEHPFFSQKKGCRKRALETPEYLTDDDWEFARQVVVHLSNSGVKELFDLLWDSKNRNITSDFFNQTVGWPEGYFYCSGWTYFEKTAFPGMVRYELPMLREALAKRDNTDGSGSGDEDFGPA